MVALRSRRHALITMGMLTDPPAVDFAVELTTAQIAEIWVAETEDEAVQLLARILDLDTVQPRASIWVDCIYQTLRCAKSQGLSGPKALVYLRVTNETYAHVAAAPDVTRASVLRFFAAQLMVATKEMAPADRFKMKEVEALTQNARCQLLECPALVKMVLTQPQAMRMSQASYFVQRATVPLPLAAATEEEEASPAAAEEATDGEPAAPDAEAAAEEGDAAAPEPEPAAEGEAPAELALSAEDQALADGISRAMGSYVETLKASMAAEHEEREKEMLQRISKLEGKK